MTDGELGAALGHEGRLLFFRNIGRRTCRLRGYPGVDGLDASGRAVVHAVRTPRGYLGGLGTVSSAMPIVALRPGQAGLSLVEGVDIPQGKATFCPSYRSLLVTPPGERQAVRLPATLPGCASIEVHPVVPGTTGPFGQ